MKQFFGLTVLLLLSPALVRADFGPRLGGDTTIEATGERAFRSIAPNAEGLSRARFTFGQQLFHTVWEPAPGSQPTTDGLGPVFNRSACSDCHINNGRGRPPESTEDPMDSMLVRISLYDEGPHGEPLGVPGYGNQLQDRGVEGVPAEGKAQLSWTEVPGEFADGTKYSLRKPSIGFTELAFGELPNDVRTSARVASPLVGLGLLEAVPDARLHELADAQDDNGDGISGRVNIVWDAEQQRDAVGRFGWKSNQPSLRQQNAGAAIGDMGLTSPVFLQENCAEGQTDCAELAAEVANPPEIVSSFFIPLLRYTQLVAVPGQRAADAKNVRAGTELFIDIGCAGCHVMTMRTGTSELEELANQTFHPFTDLLLHDMGPGLADHRHDFLASGREWRTAPLWGIGLTQEVGGFEFYLHDGRARSLEEAILWHGGEAEAAKETFRGLDKGAREQLIAFLKSI
ncbi:MAG: di-heme oxidoredictase family protein [Gammaproteobacteria bacterium]